MSETVELRHLRALVTVVATGGISRAATQLGVTQPALSRQIRHLEREWGVRLFDRVGRRVHLTSQGEDIARASRAVLTSVASLSERARVLADGHSGRLRVAVTPQGLGHFLVDFLRVYRRAHPRIHLELLEEGGVRGLDLVERGEADFAVAQAPSEGSALAYRLLFPFWVVAVTTRSARLGRRATVDLSDVTKESLLVPRPEFGSRGVFDAACRLAGVKPHIVLESGSPQSLVVLAQDGYGVAIVPTTFRLDAPGIRAVPIVHAGRPLGGWGTVAWDPRRYLPPFGEQFVDALVRHFQRAYPGKRFARSAPPIPRPSERARPQTLARRRP
jgi:DNA-binding transcriptional LysR family regulator